MKFPGYSVRFLNSSPATSTRFLNLHLPPLFPQLSSSPFCSQVQEHLFPGSVKSKLCENTQIEAIPKPEQFCLVPAQC